METKTLSERIAELNEIKKSYEFEPTVLCLKFDLEKLLLSEADNEFFEAMKVIGELQAELEKRKAYIVANPCGQCGGIINAIKCQAWKEEADKLKAENQALLAKNGKLQAENKSWQEMVDSTNQTNQALIKRLQENKNDK